MRFVDKVRIHAKAGRGGNGCLSFRREKYMPMGGPNGGNGGKGGDILLRADAHLYTLLDFTYRPHLLAAQGSNGSSGDKTGADADDMVVPVPLGTLVYKNDRLAADLSKAGDSVLVARGGRGGRGNASFKTRHNTGPRIYEKGEPGEEAELDLELKLIADVGLVGFPNAGKSTLLARLSNARPKIADYPFTTLAPHLGIVQHKGISFVLADIPGLIEGAHQGKGLGADFLRHVERTRLLVHMVDPAGFGGVSAADGVKKIENELAAYSRRLAGKPRMLAVSKMDLPEGREAVAKLKARWRKRPVFALSAATGEGLNALLDRLTAQLAALPREEPIAVPEEGAGSVKVEQGFRVSRCGRGWQLAGPYVERIAAMTDITLLESLWRLQHALKKIGVDKALKKAGVQEGDMVRIGELEFEWSEQPQHPAGWVARRPGLNEARRLRGRPRAARRRE